MPAKLEGTQRVGYFRAQNLSIFALLNIPKRDAAELLAHLEIVDREFCQKVNIIQFSEMFCPKWKSAFQILWRKYVILFNTSRKVDKGIVATYMKGKKQESFDYAASYVEVLSFLCFIASIEKKTSFAFLFWILFSLNEEPPTKVSLVEHLESLWGANNDKISKSHRVLIKKSVKHMDLDDFDNKKFRIYDWKSNRGYTIPFHSLQKELVRNIASRDVWRRLHDGMREIIDDPSVIASRLGEKKKPIGRMKSCRNIGDRREAWFELSDFVEAFLRYHEMAENLVIEPVGLLDKAYVVTRRAVRMSYATVSNAIAEVTRKPIVPEELVFDDDLLDDQSVTKLYKSALKLPVEKLFVRAEKKKELAYGVIEDVESELSIVCEYDPLAKPPARAIESQMSAVSAESAVSGVSSADYDDEDEEEEDDDEVEEQEQEDVEEDDEVD